MKTLSLKQLEQIKATYDELKTGVYNHKHAENTFRLIVDHYQNFNEYTPSIKYWYKKNYDAALIAAQKREADKKAKEIFNVNLLDS